MKRIIALLLIIPTGIAALLFTIAGFLYSSPELLIGKMSGTFITLSIIAGVICILPLVISISVELYSLFSKKVSKKSKPDND